MPVKRKTPAFKVSASIELIRGDDVLEVEVCGTCRNGGVEIDSVKAGKKDVVLSESEHTYALGILESVACDHNEDTFDFLPYFPEDD